MTVNYGMGAITGANSPGFSPALKPYTFPTRPTRPPTGHTVAGESPGLAGTGLSLVSVTVAGSVGSIVNLPRYSRKIPKKNYERVLIIFQFWNDDPRRMHLSRIVIYVIIRQLMGKAGRHDHWHWVVCPTG